MEMSQAHTTGVWCVFTQSPPLPSVYRFLEPFLTFKGERQVQRTVRRETEVLAVRKIVGAMRTCQVILAHVSLHILLLFQQVNSLNKGILDHIHINKEVRK